MQNFPKKKPALFKLVIMAGAAGLEPAANGFGDHYSTS
jgi:hypothetical protein